jgi:hypothetical protein
MGAGIQPGLRLGWVTAARPPISEGQKVTISEGQKVRSALQWPKQTCWAVVSPCSRR